MTFFLESSRLKFRHWTEDDLPLAFSLWGDPEVALYLGGALTEEQCAAKLRVEIDRQTRFGVQYWPLFERATSQFVGASGLRFYHDQTGVLELGVHIARRLWSGRFGEEAARAVIGYAFEVFPLNALVAGHNPGNNHSQALLARLGFRYTHDEPWGPLNLMHPFYRLERAQWSDPLDTEDKLKERAAKVEAGFDLQSSDDLGQTSSDLKSLE